MENKTTFLHLNTNKAVIIKKWKVKEGMLVSIRQVIFIYNLVSSETENLKFKSSQVGTVRKILVNENDIVQPGLVNTFFFFFYLFVKIYRFQIEKKLSLYNLTCIFS